VEPALSSGPTRASAGKEKGAASKLRAHLVLCALGLFAIAAGFILPEILTSHSSNAKSNEPEIPMAEGGLSPIATVEPDALDFNSFRLAGGTIVGLIACAGIVWAAKGWKSTRSQTLRDNSGFQILETLRLGNRCLIYLVKVGDARLLAGVDRGGLKNVVALPVQFESELKLLADDSSAAERPGVDLKEQLVPASTSRDYFT
jgi:flagellar biogenesis protein FliO